MKRLRRVPLSKATLTYLAKVQKRVTTAAQAKTSWKSATQRPYFVEIRAALSNKMAGGRERCMFCEDSAGTDIEHFWPSSLYPDRAFVWENYLLACSLCNGPRYKGTNFPLDAAGDPLLLDPTADQPRRHLPLEPTTGMFVAATAKGCQTIATLGLNTREALTGRRKTSWQLVLYVIEHLSDALKVGNTFKVNAAFELLEKPSLQCPGIISHFLEDALRPTPKHLSPADAAVAKFVLNETFARWRKLL